mmetsp:Transcript_7108/g.10028  ORF Transcript_7108/g.10028 Transcript_7108/m.10028 type:complete len:208 (+) Transcript_7108:287-910(+)
MLVATNRCNSLLRYDRMCYHRVAQVSQLFDDTEAQLGPVTDIVNCAGITGICSNLVDSDPETIQRVIDVNVCGSIFCSHEAVRRYLKHGGGNIVNISSGAATLGSPGEYVWYAASKGAIDTFTMGLAKEVAANNIRVNAVAPGLIETDIHKAMGRPNRIQDLFPSIPMQRVASPAEVAGPVLWLLSDVSSYVRSLELFFVWQVADDK